MPSSPVAIALFDLDGTLTRRDTYLAYLLGFLSRRPGRWPGALLLPMAAGAYFLELRDNSWLKATFLKVVLGGASRAEIDAWTDRFLERLLAEGVQTGARAAIERHRQAGDRMVLATASFDFYVEPLAERLGLHEVLCPKAEWDEEGRLTGKIVGENCHGVQKLRRVRTFLKERGHNGPVTFYSDHHSDLHLLESVDFPVTVNPTGKLRRAIAGSSIPIEDWS